MKKFLYSYLLSIAILATGLLCAAAPTIGPSGAPGPQKSQDMNFQISDEELKALNLDPKEAEELRQFFDALNNLTPSQKQELEELGRATEERMKQQNLDPNNLDDLMKFMESEGLMEQQPKGPQPQPKPEQPKPAPRPQPAPQLSSKKPDRPEIVPITSPENTLKMINELNHHFASLRQKAITIPSMVQKLDSLDSEIAQFSFFLNVLRTPQLITLLTSKDFVQLHGSLEKLHTTFKTFEPSISAQKPTHTVSTDDPYMVLGLPYNASDAEIKAKYSELAGQLSPDVVEQQLKAQGCEPKVCKKMVNAARRTFALTKNAYDSLTQNKTAIDKYLQDKMARESRKEMTSLRAFDSVIAGLTSAITQDRILQQVQQLLEKHKPEELAQMKAQIDLEKKVYERSKKRIQIQQARPSSRPQAPYESFYKKMAQQRPPTPIKPTYAGATSSSDKRSQKEGTAKEEGRGPEGKKDKKADGKKEDKKDSKDGKKDGGKKDGKKPVAKKDATPPVEPTKEDIERLTELGSVGKLLDTAKKQKEIDVTYKVRGAPMVQKEDLTKIMGRLDAELTSGTPEIQDAAKNLQEYFTTINLEGIEKALKKAAPGKGQKLSGLPAQYWKDNVVKYKDLVEQWHTTVARRLSALDRNNYNLGAAKPVKMRQHGLHENNIDPWLTLKDDESPPERDIEPGNVDLWKIRSSINAIRTYINETGVV